MRHNSHPEQLSDHNPLQTGKPASITALMWSPLQPSLTSTVLSSIGSWVKSSLSYTSQPIKRRIGFMQEENKLTIPAIQEIELPDEERIPKRISSDESKEPAYTNGEQMSRREITYKEGMKNNKEGMKVSFPQFLKHNVSMSSQFSANEGSQYCEKDHEDSNIVVTETRQRSRNRKPPSRWRQFEKQEVEGDRRAKSSRQCLWLTTEIYRPVLKMNKEQCNIIEGIHSQALLNIFNKQQQAKMVQDHKDKQIHTVARERYKQYITNTLHPAEVIVPDLYTPLKSVVRRHVEVEEEERHIHDVQNVVAKLKLYHAERIERLKLEKEADEQKQRQEEQLLRQSEERQHGEVVQNSQTAQHQQSLVLQSEEGNVSCQGSQHHQSRGVAKSHRQGSTSMQHMMCPSEVVGGDVLQNLQQSASSNSILYVERTESQTPIEAHRDILTQPQEEDNQNQGGKEQISKGGHSNEGHGKGGHSNEGYGNEGHGNIVCNPVAAVQETEKADGQKQAEQTEPNQQKGDKRETDTVPDEQKVIDQKKQNPFLVNKGSPRKLDDIIKQQPASFQKEDNPFAISNYPLQTTNNPFPTNNFLTNNPNNPFSTPNGSRQQVMLANDEDSSMNDQMSESQPLPTGNACPNFLQTTFTPLYMQSPPVESLFKQSGDESRPTRQTVELPRQTVDLPNRETGRSLAINNIGMAVFSSMTGNAGLQNLGRGESSALRGFNSGIGIDSAGMFVKGNNVNPFLQKSPESKNKSSLFDVSSSSSHVPMQRARSKKNEPRITGP